LPKPQGKQALSPPLPANVPELQATHVVAFCEPLYVPTGHNEHCTPPLTLEKNPGAQTVHVLCPCDPCVKPIAQAWHALCPPAAEKYPLGQSKQIAPPLAGAYLPV